MEGVGISNLPNQKHEIAWRKGINFNVMVVGPSGSGKTTFINTLVGTILKQHQNMADPSVRTKRQTAHAIDVEVQRSDVEERGFKCRLTIIDTVGFGDFVVNSHCWEPIVNYIDDQHARYLEAESQAVRTTIDDTRVHACLYFIQPTGHTLTPLDVSAMKELCTRVNLVPVIAKADSMDKNDMNAFKKRVMESIRFHEIQTFSCPVVEDDDVDTRNLAQEINAAMPLAVIGSERDVVGADGRTVRGRPYPWGVAEVENDAHCDFRKLRNLLVRKFMLDLMTATSGHYERYRTAHMVAQGRPDGIPLDSPHQELQSKMKTDEEELRKRLTEQVKSEEARFKQWEQKLLSERDRLNKDLEAQHAGIKALTEEIRALEQSMAR